MAHMTAEFQEPKKAEGSDDKSGTQAANRSMEEVTKERLKGTAPNGAEKLDKKVTAIGATVETDANGLVRRIGRTDGSEILASYSNDAAKRLESLVEIRTNHTQVVYKRDKDGDTFKPFSKDGKSLPNELNRSKVELSANGNLTYLDEKGQKVIVRGNGAVLPVGQDKFDVQFDTEGRATKVIPSAEAVARGAKIRGFAYEGKSQQPNEYKVEIPAKFPGSVFTHTLNKEEKKWECRDQKGVEYTTPQGKRSLSADLAYSYEGEDTIKRGDKSVPVTRVCYPNGIEVLQDPGEQRDGSHIVKTYNESGRFIGVQSFAPKINQKNEILRDTEGHALYGKPGKKYIAGFINGKPRIYEADPLNGTEIVWDKQDGNEDKWLGRVVGAGSHSPLKRVKNWHHDLV